MTADLTPQQEATLARADRAYTPGGKPDHRATTARPAAPQGFLADAVAPVAEVVPVLATPQADPADNRATPIKVELLYPAPAGRSVQADVVASLCDSIGRIGLHSPITVRPVRKVRDGAGVDAFEIVTGRHRYEACLRLGMAEIECFVDTGDAAQSRLWYLAENLHRAELTEGERRVHIAEWIRLTEEKLADASHGETHQSKKAGQQSGGVNAAARELGISKATAHRAVKAESLPDEAKALADEAGLGTVARAKAAAAADPVEAVKNLAERKTATNNPPATAQAVRPFPVEMTLPAILARRYDADPGGFNDRLDAVTYQMDRVIGDLYYDTDTAADAELIALLGGAQYLDSLYAHGVAVGARSRLPKKKRDATPMPPMPPLPLGCEMAP